MKKYAVVAASVAAAALTFMTAGAASASVAHTSFGGSGRPTCVNSLSEGYNGTQVNDNGQSVAVQGRNDLVAAGKHAYRADTCFNWQAFDGGSNKTAEYAPNGIPSDLALSAGRHNQVVLAQGSNSTSEQWLFTENPSGGPSTCLATDGCYDGTWTNVATGKVLAATHHGDLYLAPAPSSTVPSNEDWQFVAAS